MIADLLLLVPLCSFCAFFLCFSFSQNSDCPDPSHCSQNDALTCNYNHPSPSGFYDPSNSSSIFPPRSLPSALGDFLLCLSFCPALPRMLILPFLCIGSTSSKRGFKMHLLYRNGLNLSKWTSCFVVLLLWYFILVSPGTIAPRTASQTKRCTFLSPSRAICLLGFGWFLPHPTLVLIIL